MPSVDVVRHRRLRDLVERAAEHPAEHWRAFLEGACPEAGVPGGLNWTTIDRDGFWTYDGTAVAAGRTTGRLRGQILRRETAPEPLVTLCDRLRQMPGVTLVRAVAFPVKPDREVIK
jgi:hypothetical protein